MISSRATHALNRRDYTDSTSKISPENKMRAMFSFELTYQKPFAII
jgi:hypothetical protein